MNWLWDNKEWIFSGVGAAALTTFIALAWRLIRRRRAVGIRLATHHAPLSFDDVMKVMKDVPPLQIQAVGARYKGVPVSWNTFLLDITDERRDDVAIALDSGPGEGTVHCEVKLSRYKALSYMRLGEPIIVSGIIERVEPRSVFLRDAELGFGSRLVTGP